MVMWWIVGAAAVIAIIAAVIIYKRRKKKEKEMPAGIQVYNSSGALIFDLANQTTYSLGTAHTGAANGSLSDGRIKAGRTWVMVISASSDSVIPEFTVSNGSISWAFHQMIGTATIRDVTFMYGVY